MAKLTSSERNNLPSSDFAVAGRKYPLDTANRARNALSRSAGKPVAAKVRAAVHRKFPGIKQHKNGMQSLSAAM